MSLLFLNSQAGMPVSRLKGIIVLTKPDSRLLLLPFLRLSHD